MIDAVMFLAGIALGSLVVLLERHLDERRDDWDDGLDRLRKELRR